jgi:hypothetical protein
MFLSDYLPNLNFLENFNKSRPYEVKKTTLESVTSLVCGQMRTGGHTDGQDKAIRRLSPLHAEDPMKSGVN